MHGTAKPENSYTVPAILFRRSPMQLSTEAHVPGEILPSRQIVNAQIDRCRPIDLQVSAMRPSHRQIGPYHPLAVSTTASFFCRSFHRFGAE
jgi:hypothetical protein